MRDAGERRDQAGLIVVVPHDRPGLASELGLASANLDMEESVTWCE